MAARYNAPMILFKDAVMFHGSVASMMTLKNLFRPITCGLAATATVLLSACSALDSGSNAVVSAVTPYRPEVVQGNVVTKEQVAQLRTGMNRAQVRQLLGTPLVTSMFHAQRWDYVFTINRQGVPPQQRRLTVYFKADALEKFDGDDMPSELEFISGISKPSKDAKPKVLKATPEELERFREANPVEPGGLNPPATPKVYPPLESGAAR